MSVTALIPARSGSVRLPGKNLMEFAGKPLIAWTIDAAQQCGFIDSIVVSTESAEYAHLARKLGAETPYIRPTSLAHSQTSSADVVKHHFEECQESEILILLQPTSPLRTAQHITEAYNLFCEQEATSLVSAERVGALNANLFALNSKETLISRKEPRDFTDREIIKLNGAIYIVRRDSFLKQPYFLTKKTAVYQMSRELSIDIDTKEDFKSAETIFAIYQGRRPSKY